MIKVNKQASLLTIQNEAKRLIEVIQFQADKGQDRFRIHYSASNFSDGREILRLIKKEGVKCCERGFGHNENYDGSYDFDVKMELDGKR